MTLIPTPRPFASSIISVYLTSLLFTDVFCLIVETAGSEDSATLDATDWILITVLVPVVRPATADLQNLTCS